VMIQPRRVSQNMLESLFGTIREMGGNSSTQTVQSYGYAINKLTITIQMTSEIKSLNYGLADGLGMLTDLKRRVKILSTFSHQIFQELLNDDLLERMQLIEFLLYEEGVEAFLVTLSEKIRQMALNSVPLKKSTRSTNLENRLNNYKCAAYMLLEKTIRIMFKQAYSEQYHSQLILNYTESWTVSKKIVSLELAEVSKFQYIIGWTIYKLTKNDQLTLAHKEFTKIRSCLNVLSFEDIEYVCDTRSKMTTIIPGANFIQFMYYLESPILQLFEKHIEYDLKNDATKENKLKIKSIIFKKEMLPEDLDLALCLLKIWTRDNEAKSAFEKVFTLSDLKILVQAFQNEPVKMKEKKKSVLLDLLFNHLQSSSEFNKEMKKKGQLFD
ncbi:26928_t:CDS:2, partial [Racocetra persica]